ncbi:MAG: hypothetical protein AAGK37_05270 [Pseudomonadota bacterium]
MNGTANAVAAAKKWQLPMKAAAPAICSRLPHGDPYVVAMYANGLAPRTLGNEDRLIRRCPPIASAAAAHTGFPECYAARLELCIDIRFALRKIGLRGKLSTFPASTMHNRCLSHIKCDAFLMLDLIVGIGNRRGLNN